MQITELVWNLFILLLPGVVSILIIRYISTSKNYSPFDFVIYSASLGIGNFIILELLYSIFNIFHSILNSNIQLQFGLNLSIWDNLFGLSKKISKDEIFISYLFAIPIGILFGYLIRKRLILKIFQKLNLTNRYGDDDVWYKFLNEETTTWIFVRDKRCNLTYYGHLNEYSDSNDIREISLNQVSVFESDTSIFLYEIESIYLELNNFEFSIEKPIIKSDEKKSTETSGT